MTPFFTYYGGKYRAAPRYPKPRFGRIIEPFAGAAGYSVRYAGHDVTLIDKSPQVAGTWRYLVSVSPSEIMALPDLSGGQTVDDLDVPQEARWLIGWWLNKGTASPRKSPGAWMRKGAHTDSQWGRSIRERIAAQVESIRHWKIIEGDYRDATDVEATWFVDPPYQVAGVHYPQSSKAIDFADLAEWCQSRRGRVIVCENDGATWLPFMRCGDFKATFKESGQQSAEAMWFRDSP